MPSLWLRCHILPRERANSPPSSACRCVSTVLMVVFSLGRSTAEGVQRPLPELKEMINRCLIHLTCHLFGRARRGGPAVRPHGGLRRRELAHVCDDGAAEHVLQRAWPAFAHPSGPSPRNQRDDATLSSLPTCHLFGCAGTSCHGQLFAHPSGPSPRDSNSHPLMQDTPRPAGWFAVPGTGRSHPSLKPRGW